MVRPLMQRGIGELEALFAGSKADRTVLKQLEHELQYRQVPRAVALLAEVQAAIHSVTPANRAIPAPSTRDIRPPEPKQPTLWNRPDASPAGVTLPSTPPRAATSMKPLDAHSAPKPSHPPAPTMPLEDAYKLLKATANSTWDSIEQTRRQLVHQSRPERLKSMSPDNRAQALAEATKINAAYAALSQARCGGR